MKELESELEDLIQRERLGSAKKFGASRLRAADVRRFRRAAIFSCGRTHRGKNHEGPVANDRIVAFDLVLMIWVIPMALLEWDVAAACSLITITIVFGKADAPSIAPLASIGLSLWR